MKPGFGNVEMAIIKGWTPLKIGTKILFWGKYSEISSGQMPNKVIGSNDYITVSGSAGSEIYQCPNTASYISADTDYIWFKTNVVQRLTATSELIDYDFSRTLIKYSDITPYSLQEIIILKSGETLTQREENLLRNYMHLSIWWSGTLSFYGYVKGNRTSQKSIWTAEVITLLSNLVGYWKFNESSGNALDSLGSHNGTLSNITQNVTGKINSAYSFTNNPRSYVNCGSISGVNLYSISCWAKRNTLSAARYIFGNASDLSGLLVNEAGDIYFCNNGGAQTILASAVWTEKTQFHHIVAIVSVINTAFPRGTVEIYFDGVSQGVKNFVYNNLLDRLAIGISAVNYSNSFEGSIDEFGLWNKVLTATEVGQLYNSGNGRTYPF